MLTVGVVRAVGAVRAMVTAFMSAVAVAVRRVLTVRMVRLAAFVSGVFALRVRVRVREVAAAGAGAGAVMSALGVGVVGMAALRTVVATVLVGALGGVMRQVVDDARGALEHDGGVGVRFTLAVLVLFPFRNQAVDNLGLRENALRVMRGQVSVMKKVLLLHTPRDVASGGRDGSASLLH